MFLVLYLQGEVFGVASMSQVSKSWSGDSVPTLVISGDYLSDFGFDVGKKVIVEITDGQIVIKTVNAEC